LKEDGGFDLAMSAVAKRMATIRFSKVALSFQHGAVTVRTQLTQGDFPNYHSLIPQNQPHKVAFSAEEAFRAVKSLREIASEGSGVVRLIWDEGNLTISARGEETGAISNQIRARARGGEGRIAIDIRYLSGYLSGKDGQVLMETAAPSAPARFYCDGYPDVLLMPMFVEWGDEAPDAPAPAEESAPVDEAEPSAKGEEDVPDVDSSGEEPEAASAPAARAKRPRRPRSSRSSDA
jgi:hypothetical protein